MARYVPKTVREYGRIYLAERLAEHGWQCFVARRSPNEDEVIAGIAVQGSGQNGGQGRELAREVRLKFHSQERRQAVRFYDRDSLDWAWDYLVISAGILDAAPVTYILSPDDVRGAGRLEEEYDGALWLQPAAFTADDFREAWHKLIPNTA